MEPRITILSATTQNVANHVYCQSVTSRCIPHKVKFVMVSPSDKEVPVSTHHYPLLLAPGAKYDYSNFVYDHLLDYVSTQFVMIVHADGFAEHREHWTDEFLAFDYVGAPWPIHFNLRNRVGNGGFSLRSRKLLELVRGYPIPKTLSAAEDAFICNDLYDYLTENGCKFAPVPLAMRFSCENICEDYPNWRQSMSFGHHKHRCCGGYYYS